MDFLFSATRPIRSLLLLFAAWKGFLLAVALGASVAPDYDTSTSLFFERMYGANASIPLLARKLTRWDAIYFMHSTIKGFIYEQEWAFGLGLPTTINALLRAQAGSATRGEASTVAAPVIAIAISHASHLVAALALYRLTVLISSNNVKLAFVAAALHIVSPAGVFLSAPYNESPFAGLSFVGNLLFAVGLKSRDHRWKRDFSLIASGCFFGLATLFRSNGLTSGLLFAVEAVNSLLAFADHRSVSTLLSLGAPIVGGLCVAAGSVVPQTMAWMRYCSASVEGDVRPWCLKTIPSIYTFVQDYYWNVGFLRYWTLNQVPLFLLAAPMLAILIKSGIDLVRAPRQITASSPRSKSEQDMDTFVRALAFTQVVVAVLAVTTYHVQIITRISSGYPVWYWWVAGCLLDNKRQKRGVAITVFMIMYAGIQGGLFASFLPPA